MDLTMFKEKLIVREREINTIMRLLWTEEKTPEDIKTLQEKIKYMIDANNEEKDTFLEDPVTPGQYMYAAHTFEVIVGNMTRTWVDIHSLIEEGTKLTELTAEQTVEISRKFAAGLLDVINDEVLFLEKLEDIKVVISEIITRMKEKDINAVSLDERYTPLTDPLRMGGLTDIIMNLMGMTYDTYRNNKKKFDFGNVLTDHIKQVVIIDNIFEKITLLDIVGEEDGNE